MADDAVGVKGAARGRAWWLERLASSVGVVLAVLWTFVMVWLLRLGESLELSWLLLSGLHLMLFGAWPLAAVALVLRRWPLVIAAVGLVVLQLVLVVPSVLGRSAASAEGGRVTIGSVNALDGNPELPALARQLVADPPDVLVVEEFSLPAMHAFQAAGLERHYRHHVLRPTGTTGMAVYSRYPLRSVTRPAAPDNELVVDVARPGATPLRLVGVHVFPPQAGDGGSWHSDLHALDQYLDRLDGPWLAIGDFNATFDHRPYQDLLGAGRRDAHLVTGRPWARTWPSSSPLPPLLLIDHAILGPGIDAVATRERTMAGSDHRMIEVDLPLTT